MNRTEILDAARKATTTDRQTDYGPPENSFSGIADYWSLYLEQCGTWPITPEMVGTMLLLMKVKRSTVSPGKADTYIDMAGYAACTGEIATAPVQEDLPLNECEFPEPPPGWKWHNPENLTPAQVGFAEGWRLCLEEDALPASDKTYGECGATFKTKAPL
jgi:hypothetical protein